MEHTTGFIFMFREVKRIKFLEVFAGQSLRPHLEVFKIGTGDAHFWTLNDILKEPEIEHLNF